MRTALAWCCGLLLAWTPAFAGVTTTAGATKLKSGVFEPARMAPAFSLKGSNGAELTLDHYRGKVVVLGFGFTHCPEICPTTLANLAKAQKRLGPRGRDVQVLYVTVDPERDDAETMRAYLANFDPAFLGGTGTAATLGQIYKDYGVVAKKWPGSVPGAYGVEHSTFVYLIDREGRLRAMVPYGKSAEDIAHDVGILLEK